MGSPTFASFLTPEGIIVAAGLITSLVELLKRVFPQLVERVSGAVLAFSLSALLYVATALVVGLQTPDFALTVIASWLATATAAVGVYSTATHVTSSGG